MQILIGEGPNGYYKATTKTERRYLDAAFEYLLESIGAPSRNKLRAVVAARGGNPNDVKEVYGLILNALTIHTDYSQDPSFEKSATEYDSDGDGIGDPKSGSEPLGEVPYLVRIGRGDGEKELVNISMRTDGVMQSGAMIA